MLSVQENQKKPCIFGHVFLDVVRISELFGVYFSLYDFVSNVSTVFLVVFHSTNVSAIYCFFLNLHHSWEPKLYSETTIICWKSKFDSTEYSQVLFVVYLYLILHA